MRRIVCHIDMDAFFASVEQRDNPALRGKPVMVGGAPDRRGVVAAASYEARAFGVFSAMPSQTAGRLCPNGIFIRPRIDHYRTESRKIMEIVQHTGGTLEPVSIDEAYLDITCLFTDGDVDACLDRGTQIARDLKHRIFEATGLRASVGVAANKFLAKIASDFDKPDGLFTIFEKDKVNFLRPLPVRTIHGVGKVTEQTLISAGIRTIGDLQDYQGNLPSLVGSFAWRLKQFAFGIDDRPVSDWDEIKSVSSEETFERDTIDRRFLARSLEGQAQDVARRLQRKLLSAKSIHVKVRYSDFKTLTRQLTLPDPTHNARVIYSTACFLLKREKLICRPVRLLGLGASGLSPAAAEQLLLFDSNGRPITDPADRPPSFRHLPKTAG